MTDCNSSSSINSPPIYDNGVPLAKRTTDKASTLFDPNGNLMKRVNEYATTNQLNYRQAQLEGDSIMNSPFMNSEILKPVKIGDDYTGKDLFIKELLQKIKYYGLTKDDLFDNEKDMLIRLYGEDEWDKLFTVIDVDIPTSV